MTRRPSGCPAIPGLLLFVILLCPAGGARALDHPVDDSIPIVVNIGTYTSAGEASEASGEVDWFDGDEADDTICTECYAAVELRRYLCAMHGLDAADGSVFPIVDDSEAPGGDMIVIGNERSNAVVSRFHRAVTVPDTEESFAVRTALIDGVKVFLSGHDRVGTMYAVFDWLEQLGVRWYGPGLMNEAVPARPDIEFPDLDYADAPRLELRGFWVEFWLKKPPEADRLNGFRGTPDFFDWMAHNKLNLWYAGDKAVPIGEMRKRGLRFLSGGHSIFRMVDPAGDYPYDHSGFDGDSGRPADPYPVSGIFRGDTDGDGRLSYAEAHPEWYGVRKDGTRDFPSDVFGVNFNWWREELRREFVKNILAELRDGMFRYADYVEWWPMDHREWSHAPEDRGHGSPTDLNLLVAHDIRQGILDAVREGTLARDVKVNFLIYTTSGVIDPPTRPLPEGFDYDGIMGTFFPIRRCYVHSFDDPECTELNKPYRDYLAAWRESPYYKGRFMIGEYYNVSWFEDLPVLFSLVMEEDIRYYYENGARGIHYMHTPVGNLGPRTLTNYQFARQLWDPYIDVPAMLDEYFELRYGGAAETMRAFYESLEATMINIPYWKSQLAGSLRRFAQDPSTELFPDDHLRYDEYHPATDDAPDMVETMAELVRCEAVMTEALALDVDALTRARILEDEGMFRYAANTIRFYFYMVRAAMLPGGSAQWKREMLRASAYATLLDEQPIGYKTLVGRPDGMANALDASRIREVYEDWMALVR